MLSTMDAEHPMHLDGRGAYVGNLSLNSIGPERYVGIAAAFQHLILHFLIATATSTIATGSFNNDFSPYFVCCRVEVNGPAIHLE